MDCSELQDQRFTGIDIRPDDRNQPYAIWYEGQIVRFEHNGLEAERVLVRYQEHGPPVDRKTVYNQSRRKDEF